MDAQIWHEYCTQTLPAEPLAVTRQQWQKMSGLERAAHLAALQRWLGHLFLQTDDLTAIEEEIDATVLDNDARGISSARTIFAVSGCNLAGKSTFMMRWAARHYLQWVDSAEQDKRGRPVIRSDGGVEDDLCPLIWIDAPSQTRELDFDSQFPYFFGVPSQGPKRDVTRRAMNMVQRHRARVVIVDDTHLLYTDWKGGRAVLDHVKQINTLLGNIGVTLILVGANLEDGDVACDPQLSGRLRTAVVPCYPIEDADQMRVWQSIVRQLEAIVLPHLPAAKAGMLYRQLAGELWLRTQGYVGDLVNLVGHATVAAIRDGTFLIQRRHLDGVTLTVRAEKRYHELTAERRDPTQRRLTTAPV
jgi:hypothetical protein